MGTWSHGNFDNDAAMDWLGDTTGQLIAEIQEAMASPDSMQADEWDGDIVPCRIELLCVMAESGMAPRWPDPQELQQWKQSYLREWDGSIDELDPDEDYRRDRRETLVATFDRMLKLAAASAEAER